MWPNQDPRETRGRLYHATRDARRLLGENAIVRTKERYLLDRTVVDVDVDRLDVALTEGARTGESAGRMAQLERALALFRGEPLVDVDYRWAVSHIARLRSTYVELLAAIGRSRLEAGRSTDALEAAECGLQVDPLNEELWRLALAAEAAAGMRSAVEDRYRKLQTLLEQRLGLTPTKETRSLYRRLLAQA